MSKLNFRGKGKYSDEMMEKKHFKKTGPIKSMHENFTKTSLHKDNIQENNTEKKSGENMASYFFDAFIKETEKKGFPEKASFIQDVEKMNKDQYATFIGYVKYHGIMPGVFLKRKFDAED